MKKIYSLTCLLLIVAIGYGQSKQTEKADALFESYQYVDAINAYLKLIENNTTTTHIYKNLADSYYNVFNTSEASKWYAKAIKDTQNAETYFRYAQTLKSQGKYEEANVQMNTFAKMMPNDQRAIKHIANPNYIPKLADKAKLFDVEQAKVNDAEQSDFGSFLSNDNILYFVSSRNTSKKVDKWTNSPYLDIYKSVRNSNGTLSEPSEVEDLNTPYHDGPITLSADGNTIIFARDGHSQKSYKKNKEARVKVAQQGLYKANKIDGKWTDIEPLPFNSKDYSVSHPSLSEDGKTLYFASDMPGGLGDTDIWKVSVNGNQYGSPDNLGINVNTAGKEGFPFISDNNILYFASSGKQGFGGFDIFKIDLSKNEDAVNLGNPINTKSDDFSFSINTSKNVGYFSSNRSGVDNIYTAIPVCQQVVVALVKDLKTNALLANANVTIKDVSNNSITTQVSKTDGKTSFNIECDTNYILSVSKNGYETNEFPVKASSNGNLMINATLAPVNEMITDTEVKLKNIYFEFDKSNITQQGASELDKLVAIMNEYSTMSILVKSHTDTKGNASYNLKLSNQRAQATVQYLISKGISKERLSAKGVGSAEPKINCNANCTDEENAQNRRSEFLILKK